jgi:hypothetical protein
MRALVVRAVGPVVAAASIAVASSAATMGCATSPAMRDAREGRYPELRAELDAQVRSFTISNRDAAAVAEIVASREVLLARESSALERVREVRGCAFAVDDALAARMKTRDEAGALAAQTRLEDGRLGEGAARELAASADASWRAVGTRALTRERDRAARLRALVDPAPGVRRAAVHAIVSADAEGPDLDALFEAARLDPEPLVRTDAVRAIVRLSEREPAAMPRDLVPRLQDLWVGADDPVREDIAAGWAAPAVRDAGGREALRLLLVQSSGPGVIAGAGAVLRGGGGSPADVELRAMAAAVLARAIGSAVRRDRLHAIAVAPLAASGGTSAADAATLLEATRKASRDDDSGVRLGALARLTEVKSDRQDAIVRLEALIEGPSAHLPGLRSRALLALAGAGDARVQSWLVSDLADANPQVRLASVDALGMLGVVGRGAPLLADPDPSVRTRAACSVLLAARGR